MIIFTYLNASVRNYNYDKCIQFLNIRSIIMNYETLKEKKMLQKKLILIDKEIKNLSSQQPVNSVLKEYIEYLKEVKIVMELKLNNLTFSKISDKLRKSITWVISRYWSGINATTETGILTLKQPYASKIETREEKFKDRVIEYLDKNGFNLLEKTLLYAGKNKFSVDIIAEKNKIKYFFELKVGFDNHALQRAIGQIIIYQALQNNSKDCKYFIIFEKEKPIRKELKSITSDSMLSHKITKMLSTLNITVTFFDDEFYPPIQ